MNRVNEVSQTAAKGKSHRQTTADVGVRPSRPRKPAAFVEEFRQHQRPHVVHRQRGQGRETAGSLGGRQHINLALDALQLRPVTAELAHRIDGLRTIDHIAIPQRAGLRAVRHVDMAAAGKPLSDHDAYIIEAVLPRPEGEWHVCVIDVVGLGPNEVYVGQS